MSRIAVYTSDKDIIHMYLDEVLFFSLYNSPYPAHKYSTAIDIYPRDEPLFPFDEGEVILVKWFNAPKKRGDALDKEPLILVKLTPFTVAKILHVKPGVRVGEKLYYGEPLGRLIISGYMYIWSEKHMHIEIRPLHDPLRVRGAYSLRILRLKEVPTTTIIKGEIVSKEKHYILLKPSKTNGYGPTPLYVRLNGREYFAEGGFPHYGYVGLLSYSNREYSSYNIGLLHTCILEPQNKEYHTRREDDVFDGVSTYFSRELVKLVSRKPIKNLSEGDLVVWENPIRSCMFRIGYHPRLQAQDRLKAGDLG